MNLDMVLGIVRAVLAAAGGGLVANGTVTSDQWQAIGGGVLALIAAVWSILNKQQHAAAIQTALATPSPAVTPEATVQKAGTP